MSGFLILFLFLSFLSAYVTSLDMFNGKPEQVTNVVIWGFFALYIVFGVIL